MKVPVNHTEIPGEVLSKDLCEIKISDTHKILIRLESSFPCYGKDGSRVITNLKLNQYLVVTNSDGFYTKYKLEEVTYGDD